MTIVYTVATTNNSAPLNAGREAIIKTFYTKGLFWLFYADADGKTYFRTSSDVSTWSDATLVRSGASAITFSVVYNGSDYVHYAYGAGTSLFYRRGLLASDGTITWDAEQTAVAIGADEYCYYPNIILDSSNQPWIGYQFQELPGPTKKPYVTMSTATDGTWSTGAGFPYKLSDITGDNTHSVPLKLSGDVYACYGNHNDKLYGQLYNPSTGWEAEETASTSNLNLGQFPPRVDNNDDIHVVFRVQVGANYKLVYVKRTFSTSSWSSETNLVTVTFQLVWALSIDLTTNNLFLFWTSSDTINLLRYINGVWDSTALTFISGEGTFPSESGNQGNITSFYEKLQRRIGVAWVRNSAAPYDIRYAIYPLLGSAVKSTPNSL